MAGKGQLLKSTDGGEHFTVLRGDKDFGVIGTSTSEAMYVVRNDPPAILKLAVERDPSAVQAIRSISDVMMGVMYDPDIDAVVVSVTSQGLRSLRLFNLQGIAMGVLNEVSSGTWRMNMANLPSGVYLCVATDVNGRTHTKPIVLLR